MFDSGWRFRDALLEMVAIAVDKHQLPVSPASEPLEAIALVLTYILKHIDPPHDPT